MTDIARQIGSATAVYERKLSRDALLAFCHALQLDNPIHVDVDAAREAGFRDIVAPQGFVISFTVVPRDIKLSTFGVDEGNALAGGMSFTPLKPICAGDTLTGSCVLTDIRQKTGRRPMTLLQFETRLTNQFGELALIAGDTTLEMTG